MSLKATKISYSAGNKSLFRNLNFSLLPGELLMVQGQNGAGKTTFLKILTGLILPKKGEICWYNENINQSISYHQHLSYLGHQDGINLELTPKENLSFQAALNQCELNNKRLLEVLNQFSLSQETEKICQYLSAGQRRKVALSAVLLKNKPLWILDEPYTSLDKPSINILNDCLNHHLQQGGMVVMVSHETWVQPSQVLDL